MLQPEFTREECQTWLFQRDKNPRTGWKIRENETIYSELWRSCMHYGFTVELDTKSSTLKTRQGSRRQLTSISFQRPKNRITLMSSI